MRVGLKKSICKMLVVALTLGCISGTPNVVNAKSKVKLSSTKVSMTVKQKKSISLKGVKGKKVKWSTSSKKVLTIKTSGKNKQKCTLTAKKSGNATIRAKYRGKTYKCKVNVKAKSISTSKPTTTNGVSTNKPSTPSSVVTNRPSAKPSNTPSTKPTDNPVITDSPTDSPSNTPDVTAEPTETPVSPTETPSSPTEEPVTPTVTPTVEPTNTPEPVHEHTVVAGGTKDCHSKCSECGEVIEDGTKHEFTSQTIRAAIHGVQDGLVRYTCSCGYSYDETVSQHEFISCGGRVCNICGEINTSSDLYIDSYDLSTEEDNGIVGYLFKSSNPDYTDGNVEVYDLYIKTLKDGSVLKNPSSRVSSFLDTYISKYNIQSITFLNKVIAGTSCDSLFMSLGTDVYREYGNYSNIVGLDYLDTSNTTNMTSMFEGTALSGSQVFNFNTSKVTTMENMFCNNDWINQIIINFKGGTSNVKNMNSMFYWLTRCYSIKNNGMFDTSNVEDMSCMFSYFGQCLRNNGNTIGVVTSSTYDFIEGLDTSNCKYLSDILNGAFSHEENFELDLTGWSTNKLESTNRMFQNLNCANSTGFTLRINFNTSNVKNIAWTFYLAGRDSFKNGKGKIYLGSSFSSLSDDLTYSDMFFGSKSLDYIIKMYTTSTDSYNLLTGLAEEQELADYVKITKIN